MKKFVCSLLSSVIILVLCQGLCVFADENMIEFNGHFYKVYDVSVPWSEAQKYCESLGGHLLTINSTEEYNFIKTNIDNEDNWVGAYCDQTNIKWVDGSVVDKNIIEFSFNEPSESAKYFTLGAWCNYFDQAYSNRGFICECDNKNLIDIAENKNFSRYSTGWYINHLSEDGSCKILEIRSIEDNVVEFVIEQAGRYYSPVYFAGAKAIVQDDKAVFDWGDSWGNYGNGELIFEESYLRLTLNQTYTAKGNRSTLECEDVCYYPETEDLIKDNIKVILNGTELSFDQPPVLDPAGRVLVPIRKIAEAMGDSVKWNQDLQTVFVEHKERALIIPLYADHLYIACSDRPVEWKEYELDVPSQEQNGRTLTPVRAFCESLGATVNWDDSTQTVYIEYNGNYNYDSLSDETLNGINMAYSIMQKHNNISFAPYTAEINTFLDGRDSATDNAAMIYGSGIFDGIVRLASGKDATEDAIKVSLAQILDILTKINMDLERIDEIIFSKRGAEVIDALNDLPTENVKINSINDIKELSKTVPELKYLETALGDVGLYADLAAFTAKEITYILADYSQNVEWLDILEKYFISAGVENEYIYNAIYDIREAYTLKTVGYLRDFIDGGVESILSVLADKSTFGVFGIANFAKDITAKITGLDVAAEGLYEFYGTCCLNPSVDYTYQKMYDNILRKDFNVKEMIDMYNIQRAVKATAYMSMNKIANSIDEVSWNDRIDSLESMSYILWK